MVRANLLLIRELWNGDATATSSHHVTEARWCVIGNERDAHSAARLVASSTGAARLNNACVVLGSKHFLLQEAAILLRVRLFLDGILTLDPCAGFCSGYCCREAIGNPTLGGLPVVRPSGLP